MTTTPYQLIFSTCPDAALASRIARALVEERLAACVNMLPPMTSTYRWKGAVESATEQLLIIKIRAADYARVEQRIKELHSYELPEIVAVSITAGLPQYLHWLEQPDSI